MEIIAEMLITLRRAGRVATTAALLGAAATVGWAQEETGESEELPNAVSVFLGATVEPADRGSGVSFTLGVDYERRLTEYVGVGAFAEGAFGETAREAVLGIPLTVHAFGSLILVVAPLVEFSQTRGTGDTETEIGLRAGVAYELPIDRYAVIPAAYLDFVGSDVMLVLGASFSLGF